MRQNEYIFNSSAKLSIVLPAFNEERRLPPLLDALCAINHDPKDIELIVVDDGSTDGTSLICQQIINDFFPNGKVITKPKNTGKGSALRTGVAAANAPIIITMDADMATDLSAMEPAIKGLQTHHIVVGSRSIEGRCGPVNIAGQCFGEYSDTNFIHDSDTITIRIDCNYCFQRRW